jgi:DNA primase catalytic core
MARIAESEIERLKLQVSVVRLVEAAGIALKPHGKDVIGRCPFHDDRTPSLVVSPKTNLWHCLGACQAGGSVIDWTMRWHGVSFRHAVELLRQDAGAVSSEQRGPAAVRREAALALPAAVEPDAAEAALLHQVIDVYHATLKDSADAQAYLAGRGLTHPDVIDTFRLGYANRTLAYRLPEKNRKAGATLRGALQRIGVLRASGHEHFNGSLVIPVVDEGGVPVEVYGRKITPASQLRAGTPLHLYLPGPHRGVFNRAGLTGADEIIVCESLIDALTFWCAGYRHVTAAFGVSGLTEEVFAALTAEGVKRVLIAFDRDEAGDTAATALATRLLAHGVAPYRVGFPKGMDVNAYALKVGPPAQSLGLVLRKAEFMGDGPPPARPMALRTTGGGEMLPPSSLAAAVSITPAAAPVVPAPAPAASSSSFSLAAAVASSSVIDAPPPEPCSPAPAGPVEVVAQVGERDVTLAFGERRYRVRGLAKNAAFEVLKVNVLVSGIGDALHVDTLDLYQAKARAAFAKQAAIELGVEDHVIQRDLGQVLLALETVQDQQRAEAEALATPAVPALSDEDRTAALAWLRSPDLTERIVADIERIGLVGEPVNALVAYLAAVSRQLPAPLAILIQSTSAAGKSALMDTVLRLMPEEARVQYSAMTGQSLFYLGERQLKHTILAIAEEEGVRQAAYALKLLQSQGELTIASTGKDPATGKLVTEEYRVEGPVMLCLTTTAIDIDEELLNRCLVLTINESREQTRAIQAAQRRQRTLAGLLADSAAQAIVAVHRNAQRLLRPLAVVNPYADALTFGDARTRTRRDHQKYLTLIDAIALLHQYQRDVKTVEHGGRTIEYIEVTAQDIALANRLAHEVLGRSLDELPPQTRRLLGEIEALVRERMQAQALARSDVRFTRREVRAAAGLSDTQTRLHLDRLVQMEYVLAHSGRNGQRFVYELVFDGDGATAAPQLPGLIDVATLPTTLATASTATTATWRGEPADLAGGLRPADGPLAATLRAALAAENPSAVAASGDPSAVATTNARHRSVASAPSYAKANGGSAPAPAASSLVAASPVAS